MMTLLKNSLLVIFLFLVSACGKTGDLYLPEETTATTPFHQA